VAIGLEPRDPFMLRGHDTAALGDMPMRGLKFAFFHGKPRGGSRRRAMVVNGTEPPPVAGICQDDLAPVAA
jgi:hypothetical protein